MGYIIRLTRITITLIAIFTPQQMYKTNRYGLLWTIFYLN